jgi:DNA-binding response OmpR family regulator
MEAVMRILTLGELKEVEVEVLRANHVESVSADENDGMEGLLHQFRGNYDAIVLNIGSKWGIQITHRMRSEGIATPVVAVTEAELSSKERTTFLESGGDELVKAPVDPQELVATLKALARRYRGSLSDIRYYSRGGVIASFNRATGELKVNGKKARLTFREMKLVEILCVRSPKTVSEETIHKYLYPEGDAPTICIIEILVTSILKKLYAIHSDAYDLIENIKSEGYRMSGD